MDSLPNQSKPAEATGQANDKTDLSKRLFKPVLVFWSIIFAWLAATRVYNPDEFEALHQGWLLFAGKIQYSDFNSNHPPILFQLLRLLNYVSDQPTVLLHLARAVSFAAVVANLIFVYRIARSIFNDSVARWAIIVFVTNATLWEWAVEIRTDTLLVPLWLAATSLVVDPRRPTPRRAIAVGLLMGTAFWVNQKAVLHSVPLGLFMVSGGVNRQWKFKDWGLSVLVSTIPAAIVLGHAAYVGSLNALFENNFSGGADLVNADPYAHFRWSTLASIVRYDFGMVALLLISYLRFGNQIFKCSNSQRFAFLGSLWMMLTFLWTPGPFGYYMLSVFPIAFVIVGWFLSQVPWDQHFKTHRRPLLVALTAYCLFPLSWLIWFIEPTNRYQREAISIGTKLTDGESKVFDFSGALINRQDSYRFHTRQTKDEWERFANVIPPLIPELKKNGCDLMLRYDRTDPINKTNKAFPEETWDQLPHQFVKIWGPIHVPGYDSLDKVTESKQEIELWYDGTYETKTPGLLIDGRPFDRELELTAGKHTITLEQPNKRIQILNAAYRSQYRSHGALPPDTCGAAKFLYIYWTLRHRH